MINHVRRISKIKDGTTIIIIKRYKHHPGYRKTGMVVHYWLKYKENSLLRAA
jgi:hypothetical protein